MPTKKAMMDEIAEVIFWDGNNSSNTKNLHKHLRIWFKILLCCIHHRPSTNSSNYIKTNQKYMLYYLSYGIKMNLPYILFKYLGELVRETRDGSPNPKKWIPLGRLISDIIFESKLVHTLIEVSLTKEVEADMGKTFNRRNLKNMSLITTISDPYKIMGRKIISSRIIPIDGYPIFTKEDPIELMESYIGDCLATCLTTIAYSFDELPDHASDVYSLKIKRKSK